MAKNTDTSGSLFPDLAPSGPRMGGKSSKKLVTKRSSDRCGNCEFRQIHMYRHDWIYCRKQPASNTGNGFAKVKLMQSPCKHYVREYLECADGKIARVGDRVYAYDHVRAGYPPEQCHGTLQITNTGMWYVAYDDSTERMVMDSDQLYKSETETR